jgi:hypothetical protein
MSDFAIGNLVMFEHTAWKDFNIEVSDYNKETVRKFINEIGTIKEISGDFAKIEYFDGFVLSLPMKYLTKGDWFK